MYQALPLWAPLPSAPACLDTTAVLKPLPPRNCPVNPCLRASIMFFAETVTEDVFARIRFWVVAVRHDVNAGGADREDRNLETLGERMHRDRRVREGRTEEAEQLTLLDEGLRDLGGLRLVRVVVLD